MGPAPEISRSINNYMTIMSAILLFASLILFVIVYKIDKNKVIQMQKEIIEHKVI